MKKSLFFVAAASALMLTACSSESDVVQNTTPQTQPTTVQQQAVGFDVYTPAATNARRAGLPEGVMTTDKLKTEDMGFGVFAYYHDNNTYAPGLKPDFMYNEHVHWTNAGGWTYSPLKYWPNETDNDSQTDPAIIPDDRIDKLSFFAYAPYVATGTEGLNNNNANAFGTDIAGWDTATPQTYGISAIKRENQTGDPLVEWKMSYDLDKNVDLLWGVSPGLSYQAVNTHEITKDAGFPLQNLVKPDKDQKIKFLFQHALSRIGLSVVSAIDQIAAGDDGGVYNNAQTRVLIEDVTVWGNFGEKGVLNLNNTQKNVAEWDDANVVKNTTSSSAAPAFTFDNGSDDGDGSDTDNSFIRDDLRYKVSKINTITTSGDAAAALTAFNALDEGVLTTEKGLLSGGPDPSKKVEGSTPAYPYGAEPGVAVGSVLYKVNASGDYVIATETTEDVDTYTKDASNNFTQYRAAGDASKTVSLDGTKAYYKITATPTTETTEEGADHTNYWTQSGAAGNYEYTFHASGHVDKDAIYYSITETALAPTGNKYSTGEYYTGLLPRYIMTIPSKRSAPKEPTSIGVKIKYHVITYDPKLQKYISDVTNEIIKTTSIQLESGKSYNLKLILGLTSVKLDAVVGEWQVGDDAEVWLPQNVE